MREHCSCGASIRTISYRRVKQWRTHYHHETDTPPLRPDTDSRTEIGFRPDTWNGGAQDIPDVNT